MAGFFRGLEGIVLGVFLVLWGVGTARAAIRRGRTVFVRVVGLALAGGTLLWLAPKELPDTPALLAGQWPHPWIVLGALTLAGGEAYVQLMLGELWRRGRGAPGREAYWYVILFPVAVAGGVILGQRSIGVARLILFLGAVAWLFGLLCAAERRAPVAPRLAGLGLAAAAIAAWPPHSVAAAESEIAVAVYRELVSDGRAHFVELRGSDPPPAVLRALAELGADVRPASVAPREPRAGRGRLRGASLVWIRAIRRSPYNPTTVEVYAGERSGPLDAAGFLFHVVWSRGGWIVVDRQMRWIS